MRPALLWLTAFVLGAAVGLGILMVGLYVSLGLLPVLALIALSNARLVGAAGLLWGLGASWLLSNRLAQAACATSTAVAGQSGCGSPAEQILLTIAEVMLAVGTVLLVVGVWFRRRPSGHGREQE